LRDKTTAFNTRYIDKLSQTCLQPADVENVIHYLEHFNDVRYRMVQASRDTVTSEELQAITGGLKTYLQGEKTWWENMGGDGSPTKSYSASNKPQSSAIARAMYDGSIDEKDWSNTKEATEGIFQLMPGVMSSKDLSIQHAEWKTGYWHIARSQVMVSKHDFCARIHTSSTASTNGLLLQATFEPTWMDGAMLTSEGNIMPGIFNDKNKSISKWRHNQIIDNEVAGRDNVAADWDRMKKRKATDLSRLRKAISKTADTTDYNLLRRYWNLLNDEYNYMFTLYEYILTTRSGRNYDAYRGEYDEHIKVCFYVIRIFLRSMNTAELDGILDGKMDASRRNGLVEIMEYNESLMDNNLEGKTRAYHANTWVIHEKSSMHAAGADVFISSEFPQSGDAHEELTAPPPTDFERFMSSNFRVYKDSLLVDVATDTPGEVRHVCLPVFSEAVMKSFRESELVTNAVDTDVGGGGSSSKEHSDMPVGARADSPKRPLEIAGVDLEATEDNSITPAVSMKVRKFKKVAAHNI
jgi:hypothetical protein